jgi:hypothetical protein
MTRSDIEDLGTDAEPHWLDIEAHGEERHAMQMLAPMVVLGVLAIAALVWVAFTYGPRLTH